MRMFKKHIDMLIPSCGRRDMKMEQAHKRNVNRFYFFHRQVVIQPSTALASSSETAMERWPPNPAHDSRLCCVYNVCKFNSLLFTIHTNLSVWLSDKKTNAYKDCNGKPLHCLPIFFKNEEPIRLYSSISSSGTMLPPVLHTRCTAFSISSPRSFI